MKAWLPILIALHIPLFAQSQLPAWNWRFSQTEYLVGPSDSFVIDVIVSVPSSSPVPLRPESVVGTLGGDLQKTWKFQLGEIFDYQSFGAGIAPGQSLTLHWGTLTPLISVSAGTYHGDTYVLGIQHEQNHPIIDRLSPGNNFAIVVVPVPTTLSIAAFALVLLFAVRYFRAAFATRAAYVSLSSIRSSFN